MFNGLLAWKFESCNKSIPGLLDLSIKCRHNIKDKTEKKLKATIEQKNTLNIKSLQNVKFRLQNEKMVYITEPQMNSMWFEGIRAYWVFVYELSGCEFESRCSHEKIIQEKLTKSAKIWSFFQVFIHNFPRQNVRIFPFPLYIYIYNIIIYIYISFKDIVSSTN